MRGNGPNHPEARSHFQTAQAKLIDRLGARGYTDADIRKILGENYLRVFAQVWR